MKNMVDCFFIGHNEMHFNEYERMVKSMGASLPAYRDLGLNFIRHNDEFYTASEAFNAFCYGNDQLDNSMGASSLSNLFSSTIAYLGSFLHRRGFTFDYVNSFQLEKTELIEKLKLNNIRVIAIPTTLYISVLPVLEIVALVKEYNQAAKIVIGGPFISTQIKTAIDDASLQYFFRSVNADFYINSPQGEDALAKIVHAVKYNEEVNNIGNIFYRKADGYIKTHVFAEDNKLEENMVDWSLFAERIGKLAAVRTAISCPFSCSFCGFPQHAGKYQTVNVDLVEKELDDIDSIGRVSSLNFIDDTLNVPPDRFKELLRMMIRKKYKFKWNSHYRCQFADHETVELMKESGCEGVFLGIESGNDEILKNMNKAASLDKYRNGITLLKEYEITTYASFIIGFPGETVDTVRDTVSFIEEYRPDFFRTQLWYCDTTTPIWLQREKYDIQGSQFQWSHKTMDSNTACDLIEDIFLNIKNSIWVPQYNFEFAALFNLIHRGMSIEQVKQFINYFNDGIKEKLLKPHQTEVSSVVIENLKNLFGLSSNEVNQNTQNIIDKYGVDFDL